MFGVDTPAVVRGCGMGSGSGWVAVGPLKRGDRGGSNGGEKRVAVAVLAELWRFFFIKKMWW
jgi:hypothetical protein